MLLMSAILGVCLANHQPVLEPLWRTDGLDAPESVIAHGDTGYIVSNINGEPAERNGRGYLARLDAQGRIADPAWVDGLDAPKGLAIAGSRLFVTDIDTLVEIALDTGEILARHPVEGALFLNDAAAHDGRIYMTDSRTDRIYVHDGTRPVLWLEDARLDGANGLWPEDGRLLVTTMARGEVLAVDWQDRSIRSLVDGLVNADGIAPAATGGYVISQWPGDVVHWREGEAPAPMITRQDPPVLMNDLTVVEDVVVIPHLRPGAVSAWRIGCRRSGSLTRK